LSIWEGIVTLLPCPILFMCMHIIMLLIKYVKINRSCFVCSISIEQKLHVFCFIVNFNSSCSWLLPCYLWYFTDVLLIRTVIIWCGSQGFYTCKLYAVGRKCSPTCVAKLSQIMAVWNLFYFGLCYVLGF
jgi:hypothetical protein